MTKCFSLISSKWQNVTAKGRQIQSTFLSFLLATITCLSAGGTVRQACPLQYYRKITKSHSPALATSTKRLDAVRKKSGGVTKCCVLGRTYPSHEITHTCAPKFSRARLISPTCQIWYVSLFVIC